MHVAMLMVLRGRTRDTVGPRPVHVKLTPDGQFEGCEPAAWWPPPDRPMPDVYVHAHPTNTHIHRDTDT
jgi:hypothetical protein